MTKDVKNQLKSLRTWIEMNARAAKKNYDTFRKLVGRGVKLWSVVKSNAYGHGLYAFSAVMDEFGIDGFCVDSVVEGLSMRKAGIKKPILVLGQTLPSRYAEAAKYGVTITISNFDALRALGRGGTSVAAKSMPDFHIKVDTGMNRQGFYLEEIPKVIAFLNAKPSRKPSNPLASHLKGIYTHFASAKDVNYPSYTDEQLKKLKKAVDLFEKAGFKKLIKHASATGGTLVGAKYHLDAVRVGIGLYGLWPSKELEVQLGSAGAPATKGAIKLHPVLSWRTVAHEIKKAKAGDFIGYDLTERLPKDTTIAILPIGYWHGFPRVLSSLGEVIVRGKRARVLGRVSMDMIAVAVPPGARTGDVVTLIGRDGSEEILAAEPAAKSGTIHYEFLTRLNPLMERVIIK